MEEDKTTGRQAAQGTNVETHTGDATGQAQLENARAFSPGDPAQANGGKQEKTFTQAEVDAIISDRLDRERRKQEADAKKAQEAAEAKRMEEQQEFQKLAETRQAKIAELEKQLADLQPTKERVIQLEGVLKTYLDKEREGLPDAIKGLLDSLDVVKQLEWLAANKKTIKGASAIPATPAAKGDGKMTDDERRKRAFVPRF